MQLFFILSGFCLVYQVFSRPDRPYSFKTYALHRFRRIYPPYFASLLAAVCLAAVAWSRINAHLHWATEPVSIRSLITALMLVESHYCLPFWSLVIEMQWYIIVPILAILWKRSRWAMHSGTLFVIGVAAVLDQLQVLHLRLLVMYLPIFWIGIVIADIVTMQDTRVRLLLQRGIWLVLMLAGALAIYIYVPPPPVWGQTTAHTYPFAIFYTGLLSAALFTKVGRRLFSCRWLTQAGECSYSLYLVHALVIYVAIVLLDHYKIGGKRELAICVTALPLICVSAGYAFYLALEKRITHRGEGAGRALVCCFSASVRPTAPLMGVKESWLQLDADGSPS